MVVAYLTSLIKALLAFSNILRNLNLNWMILVIQSKGKISYTSNDRLL